eukprot:c4895_g1_i1 orf=1-210(-)
MPLRFDHRNPVPRAFCNLHSDEQVRDRKTLIKAVALLALQLAEININSRNPNQEFCTPCTSIAEIRINPS